MASKSEFHITAVCEYRVKARSLMEAQLAVCDIAGGCRDKTDIVGAERKILGATVKLVSTSFPREENDA